MQTPTDLDGLRRRVQQAIDGQIAGASHVARRDRPRDRSARRRRRAACSPAARGCVPGSSTGATGRPAAPTPTRSCASRRAWSSSRAPPCSTTTSWTAATPDGVCRPPTVPWQRCTQARGWDGDADRFGEGTAILAGDLCLTWCDELYATCGLPAEELARGPAPLRRDAHAAHGRPVPRPARVGARLGRARPRRADRLRPQGDPLQEREVHHRAPAAHRRARRRRDRTTTSSRCPTTASPSARRSSCATTCSASSATPRPPASPRATTCARASARCSSPCPRRGLTRGPCPRRLPARAATTSSRAACSRSAGCSSSTGAVDRVEELIATLADDARKAVGRAREGGPPRRRARSTSSRRSSTVSTARHA